MKKIPTVTIGIPAYNEEANITNLLLVLTTQKEDSFKIEKILVVSDGSEDKTNEIVKHFNSELVELIVNDDRMGQINCQNLIFKMSESDIVVLLEADTIPQGRNYLVNLINPLVKDNRIKVTQGNIQPSLPRNLFQSTLFYHQRIYLKLVFSNEKTKNWICLGRGGKAYSKSFYRNFSWPKNIPEDLYTFLYCKSEKIGYEFVKKSTCNYQLPSTYKDFLRERQKIASGKQALKTIFSSALLDSYYKKPVSLKIEMFLNFLVSEPSFCFSYILYSLRLAKDLEKKSFIELWPITPSTKKVFS